MGVAALTSVSLAMTESFHANKSLFVNTTNHPITTVLGRNSYEQDERIWTISDTMMDTPTTPTSSVGQFIYKVQLTYTPVLTILGITANTIVSIVIMGSSLRKLSSSHYICAIASVNSLYLAMLFLKWLTLLQYNIYHRPIVCQLVDMLCNIASFLSIWLAVAFCVDRYIAISWPPETPRMCNVVRARIVICLMVIISLIVYLNTSLTVGVLYFPKGPECVPLPMPFRSKPGLRILEIIGNHAVPFTTMCVLLSLISRTIYQSNRGLTPLWQSANSQLRQVTLVYFIAFLMFQIPADCLKTVLFIDTEFIETNRKLREITHFQLWLFVTEYLAHTGMAMNLVILTTTYPLLRHSLKQYVRSFQKHFGKRKSCHCCGVEIYGNDNMHLREGCNARDPAVEMCVSTSSTI